MRILMTTDVIGGVWTFTQELATGLLERGCAVALVSLGRLPSTQQQHWADAMVRSWDGCFCFRSTETPLEWMQGNDRAYSEAAPLLLRLAEQFEADLLHCNQFCFGALPVSTPKVVTAHSDVLSWAESCRNVPLEESSWLRQYRYLVREGLDQADAVIAPTCWMMNALSRNFRLPREQQIIANGRTIALLPQTPRKLQAVTAGRLWDEAKNIGMFSHVDSPMPLIIAGDDCCEQETAPADLKHAEFLGALSQEALLSCFAESAIYICSSIYEPFGLAPLEAALCGCAVLAHDIPSLREVWDDGAIYFSDADSLSQALQALHADTQLLARAQIRSFLQARRYSRAAMISAYHSRFEAVLARNGDLAHVA
jgi:glycosyltransferase involved in cell wall biosynthesis